MRSPAALGRLHLHRVNTGRWGPPSQRVLLLGCAAVAAAQAVVTDQPAHGIWGATAALGYLLLSVSRLADRPGAGWWAGAAGAVLPMGVLVLARTTAGDGAAPDGFAQPEVRLVEAAARRWVETGTPYPSPAETAALAASGHGIDGYFPYLPGTAVFGLPRALLGAVWWTDARVVFVLLTVACVAFALRRWQPGRAAGWTAAGNPVVGLTAATGGHDLPMAGLLLAAFACWVPRPDTVPVRAVVTSGLLAGLALTTKPTAWPVVLVLLALAGPVAGRRAAVRTGAIALLPVLACLPALLTAGLAVVAEQLVSFPAGLAAVASPAGSPLPGAWLAALPHGRPAALVLLGVAAMVVTLRLWRRPPLDAGEAALVAAVAMTIAIALAPSSRVGWLVLPLLLLTLPATLRHGEHAARRHGGHAARRHRGHAARRHGREETVSVDAWDCSAEAAAQKTPHAPSPPPPSSGPTRSGARS